MSDNKEKKEYRYGKEGKTITFVDDDKRHGDLRIRLRHDGITQIQFFQRMITGYLNNDERIIDYLTEYKYELGRHGKRRIAKSRRAIREGEELFGIFDLSPEEKQGLFDMIAKEMIE